MVVLSLRSEENDPYIVLYVKALISVTADPVSISIVKHLTFSFTGVAKETALVLLIEYIRVSALKILLRHPLPVPPDVCFAVLALLS